MLKRIYYSILDAEFDVIVFRCLAGFMLLITAALAYLIVFALFDLKSNSSKEYAQQYHYCIVANKTLPNPEVVCRSQAILATQK